jgi:hypothetical protein
MGSTGCCRNSSQVFEIAEQRIRNAEGRSKYGFLSTVARAGFSRNLSNRLKVQTGKKAGRDVTPPDPHCLPRQLPGEQHRVEVFEFPPIKHCKCYCGVNASCYVGVTGYFSIDVLHLLSTLGAA